ncbi:7,8-didemethyl-8-hydroxy-5-deazariboflavin synthase CofG [Cellulomonas hominis]
MTTFLPALTGSPDPADTTDPDLLRVALDRAEAGAEVDVDDATALLGATGEALDRLLAVASRVRDEGLVTAGRPRVVTYSRKVFLPITTLCRDRCHYCVFVDTPGKLALKGKSAYLSPEQILEVARAGAALGCKEALFTLGDRPEERWPLAREWLTEHGYTSTLDYVRAMARLVLTETGLLPHLNPGVMSWSELQRLRPYAPSMGMMLETTSTALWTEPGGAHFGSPDKDPAVRLRVLEDAGRSRIPFSTGVLLGIGETLRDRAESLVAIRASHERWGHVQETIVQNFRTKPGTAMQNEPDLGTLQYVAAVAVARLVMGPDAHVQAPPNLTDPAELHLLVRAGIDDWGGVSPLTPDHVNPERPWPHLDDLTRLTADAGYELRERLTAHPRYVTAGTAGAAGAAGTAGTDWIDERILPYVRALDDGTGLAVAGRAPVGRPWGAKAVRTGATAHPTPLGAVLRRAEADPAGLSDADYVALLGADGPALDALADLADRLRHDTVGDDLRYVVNRNVDGTRVGAAEVPDSAAAPALDLTDVAAVAADAWARGATEVCVQGAPPAALPGTVFLDLVSALVEGRPGLHVHGFRPAEIADGAARLRLSPIEFLVALRERGLGSVPGTAARILDDDVRAVLSGGTDVPAATWVDLVTTAHHAGLRSTATMVYGHVESPAQQVAHLRTLARTQDDTGGFTELIAMPFVPADHPVRLPASARPGPDLRETRAVHAVARLLLTGRIDHVQAAWPKLGLAGTRTVLRGGADDAGGLLLGGGPHPLAGAEAGRSLDRDDLQTLADELGRPLRQRTTLYADA